MPTPLPVLVTGTTATVAGRSLASVEAAYTDALVAAGLLPLVLPPMAPDVAVAALRHVAGLVLTGGEDIDPRWFDEPPHPALGATHVARDAYEIALVLAARERGLPTLALCRGQQILNVALGGSLIQDLPSQRPGAVHPKSAHPSDRVHAVEIEPASRLAAMLGATRVEVNSFHHQAIGRVAAGVRVVGRSPDGVVEAIESVPDEGWWMVGVQWHPEYCTGDVEEWDRQVFSGFAEELRRR